MWDKVSKFASDAWTAIKNVFKSADTWMKDKFEDVWEGVKSAFAGVGGFFGGIWNTIKDKFTGFGTVLGNAVGGAFKLVINGILGNLERSINGWIKLLNGAISIINKIPGVNISTIREMSIPRLARGGIIDRPMIAEIGENGKEAVMPLENNTGWISELASKISNQGGGNDRPVEVILQIGSTTMGRVVIDSLDKLRRQEGRLALEL
jgi:phage-related protein